MASVSTYLNFPGTTEEAFLFYQSIFGTEFIGEISRFSDIPEMEGVPPIPDAVKNAIMHISLPIYGGHVLMGTDALEGMGFQLVKGNNVHISLQTDHREETERMFEKLSEGGSVEMPLHDAFWGAYYGSCTDRFGIHWMFNCAN